MALVAVLHDETKPVVRFHPTTAQAIGINWCPFCDRSAQADRNRCRCGAEFVDDAEFIDPPADTEVEPQTGLTDESRCTCDHTFVHHGNDGQCRSRQHCGCLQFTLASSVGDDGQDNLVGSGESVGEVASVPGAPTPATE